MMDMDGVKRINDTHGHLFGAHVIGETGRLIARVLGSQGRACRFGGDEFSAFLPGHDLTSAICDCRTDSVRRRNRGDGEGWDLSETHDQHRCGLLSRIGPRTARPHLQVRRSTLSSQSARQELRFQLSRPTLPLTERYRRRSIATNRIEVKAIKIHHLVPGRYEVIDELLLRVITGIDFRDGSKLRI